MFHRFFIGLAVVFVCTIVPGAQASAQNVALIKDFDKEVREARLEMREYCSIAQKMMKSPELDTVVQAEALAHLRNCRLKWNTVIERYSTNPPAEYKPDVKFGSRLTDIASAMQDMELYLSNGQSAKSFQACSHACGLFVAMHEENNLVYGLDRIFHLRKLAKTLASGGAIGGPAAIRDMLPELMHQRDRIFTAICPWPDNMDKCTRYRVSLKTLSGTIDDLAISVSNGDKRESSELLRELVDVANRAYGDAL